MGKIKISHVVNYTSQDERYPVDNIINNTEKNLTKKWLSSPFDKSRRLEAEFQLESSSYIHYVDIGNSGSCSIDLHVGSSAWPRSQPYINLLPTVSFMTLADIKAGASPNGVKMFNKEDMNKDTHHQRYNRIRVICHQPYIKPLQFGLSFLDFRNSEMIPAPPPLLFFKPEEFYSKNFLNVTPPSTERTPRTSSKQVSRGHKMVDLALTNTKMALKQSDEDDTDDFEMKVTLFMTCKDAAGMDFGLNDCEEQFEESNMISLTTHQKEVFKKIYCSVFSRPVSNRLLSGGSIISTNSLFNPPKDYSNIRKKGTKRSHLRANSPVTVFDVDFSSKKSRSSQIHQSIDEENPDCNLLSDTSIPSHISLSAYTDDSTPSIVELDEEFGSSESTSFYRADDFVQFDGSVPSTSRDTSYVDCPICAKQFHVTEIETHAASCEDYPHPNLDDSEDDDDDIGSSAVIRPKNILPQYRLTKC